MAYTDLFSFYRSKEWESLRRIITSERVNHTGDLVCEACGKVLLHPYEAICHHVQELTEVNVHDANISLNPDNIQVLCHGCHNKVHERWGYTSRAKKIYVVWGSPCAGKTKYVMDSAGDNDLIVDMDRLYTAMSTDAHRGSIKGNVLSIYRSLVDQIRTRNGRWRCAWVVRTLPLNIDRERIIKELGGGELVHIDTPEEECMEEAQKRGGDWVKWTEEYWNRFQEPDG